MIIKGLTADVLRVMNNAGDKAAISNLLNGPLTNEDSPLTDAQRMADIRSQTQQKRPLVFEYPYLDSNYKVAWKSVELYINPERISIGTAKIKSKHVTRGGIVYHHWGDDHGSLSLAGTTGLAGMKGIQQLEEIYHASGTLLRYGKHGPEKINLTGVKDFEVIDYNDPLGVLSSTKKNLSKIKLGEVKSKLDSRIKQLEAPKPVFLGKMEISAGQIGTVKITKNIQAYNSVNAAKLDTTTFKKTLLKDGTYKVFRVLKNVRYGTLLDLGSHLYIKNLKGYVQYSPLPTKIKQQKEAALKYEQAARFKADVTKKNQDIILKISTDMYLAGMSNLEVADKISNAGAELYTWEEKYVQKYKKKPSVRDFYQQAQYIFQVQCPELSSEIKNQLAYQHTMSEYGENNNDVKLLDESTNSTRRIIDNSLSSVYEVRQPSNQSEDSTITLNEDYFGKNISWDGKALVKGQIGRVVVKKDIFIYSGTEASSQVLTRVRTAKKGETLPAFKHVTINGQGMIKVGVSYGKSLYVAKKDDYITYQTVSKTQLNQLAAATALDDMAAKISYMSVQRSKAINMQIMALEEFYENEENIRNQLKASALKNDFTAELTDKWKPRSVICYFENRAYIGHFDAFSYARIAQTPLISYDLKFTITKQIVGQN